MSARPPPPPNVTASAMHASQAQSSTGTIQTRRGELDDDLAGVELGADLDVSYTKKKSRMTERIRQKELIN